jgi:hypothetical protein
MAVKVDVYGVRETLVELRKYERTAYTIIVADLKMSAKPAADAVGREFPEQPLLNWHSSGGRLRTESNLPPYNGATARKKVRVAVSTKKPTGIGQHGLVRLQQMDGGGQVYDSAGSDIGGARGASASAGQKFVANLDKRLNVKTKKNKYRSRVMYPATEKHLPLIENAVKDSIRKIDSQVQKRLNG